MKSLLTTKQEQTLAQQSSTLDHFPIKRRKSKHIKILVLFGTRPEVIKLSPIIQRLRHDKENFQTVVVSSGQHTDLIKPFVRLFKVRINRDLQVMTETQTPNEVCSRILTAFDAILRTEKPDIVIVQGDTTTALAGAITAFHRQIAVGHVEAGLRSGSLASPFPEEMNRRLISQLATFHFAATKFNRETLINEGVNARQIFVTGNPVVDALQFVLQKRDRSRKISKILQATDGLRRILLTTHRRESFGLQMQENLFALRQFIERHPDTALIFPVHPNPAVKKAVDLVFTLQSRRILLLEPLAYTDFILLMANSWLVVSDSGGIQEEAASVGKPLLILRGNTERPEAIASGVAKLVGGCSRRFAGLLEENYVNQSWISSIKSVNNPFGDGHAAEKIVRILSGDDKSSHLFVIR